MAIEFNENQLRKSSRSALSPEALYNAILSSFPSETPILARRIVNGNKFVWPIPNNVGEKWSTLGDASDLEANAIRSIITDYKKRIQNALHLSNDDVDAVFKTPNDDSCIFFSVKGTDIQVCITGWDFTSNKTGKQSPVIVKELTNKQKVSIEFLCSERPIPNQPFKIKLPSGFEKNLCTDNNGLLSIGNFSIGTQLQLKVPDVDQEFSFVVNIGQELYYFEITRKVVPIVPDPPIQDTIVPSIVVLNESDQPVPNIPLDIALPTQQSVHGSTDDNGSYQLPKCNVGEQINVTEGLNGTDTTFTIQRDIDKYILKVTMPIVSQEIEPLLLVVNEGLSPMANIPLEITLPSQEIIHVTTDENGKYQLPSCKVGDSFSVVDPTYGTESTYQVEQDVNEYILRIKVPEVPEDVKPYLQVLDQDGNTVKDYPLTIIMPSGENVQLFTNDKGQYDDFSVMKVGDKFQVIDGFTNQSVSYEIQPNQEEYIYTLGYTPSEQDQDIVVKVVDEHERPITNGRISLSQGDTNILVTLSENGSFYLSEGTFLRNNLISVKLIDGYKQTFTSSDFKLIDNENEYIIQLDAKNCPLWKRMLALVGIVLFIIGCIASYPYLWECINNLVLKTY